MEKITKFSYQAVSEKSGDMISGVVDAESEDAVKRILSDRGCIPLRIKKKRNMMPKMNWEGMKNVFAPIRTREIILFTKQFRTMVRAGIPMLELLQVLDSQTENVRLKSIIGNIAKDMREGTSIYDAFKKHPEAFSPLYCSILRAGEHSGALFEVLERLTYIMEHEDKIVSDVKSAFRYPLFVLLFLCIAFLMLVFFVIPQFVTMFKMKGIILPLPTRICLLIYEIINHYWYVLLLTGGGSVLAIIIFFRTEQGRYIRDALITKIPVFGTFFIKAAMARFASIFSILQYSGVPVLDSLSILSGAIGNAAISREFVRIKDEIKKGCTIATPLRDSEYFTPMVINMVAIGEKSEKLDEMLGDVAKHYDSEVEYAMTGISESIGPVLTIGIAVVVGFFALAIFLPMWDMISITK